MYDLPTAPGALLGYTSKGRPIFLAAGGSEDGDSGSTDDTGGSDADNGGGTGSSDGDDASGDDDGGQGAPDVKPPAPTGGDDSKARIAQLEKQLAEARAERGKERINAKETAAKEARDGLAAEIAKALGLTKDDEDKAPDPKALADQLAVKEKAHRETTVELAIYRSAGKHGADAGALTDSREFMAKVNKLDPTADDFGSKLGDAVKKAVTDNPRYKTPGQAPGTSGGEITGGSGERPKTEDDDLSVDDLRAKRRKARGLTAP